MQLRNLHWKNALYGSITDCLVLLSTGDWPQLEFLWQVQTGLWHPEVDATALSALAKSKWPSLYYLNLTNNRLSRGDFRLVGADAACIKTRDMCRNVWPKLHVLDY